MNHSDEFKRLLRQIMSKEPEPIYSPDEIHFDRLAMEVMELMGDRWVVWPEQGRYGRYQA